MRSFRRLASVFSILPRALHQSVSPAVLSAGTLLGASSGATVRKPLPPPPTVTNATEAAIQIGAGGPAFSALTLRLLVRHFAINAAVKLILSDVGKLVYLARNLSASVSRGTVCAFPRVSLHRLKEDTTATSATHVKPSVYKTVFLATLFLGFLLLRQYPTAPSVTRAPRSTPGAWGHVSQYHPLRDPNSATIAIPSGLITPGA